MYIYVYFIIIVLLYYIFMYSNNLEGRQGSDLIQYSTPWEYELTNKQTNKQLTTGWAESSGTATVSSTSLFISLSSSLLYYDIRHMAAIHTSLFRRLILIDQCNLCYVRISSTCVRPEIRF